MAVMRLVIDLVYDESLTTVTKSELNEWAESITSQAKIAAPGTRTEQMRSRQVVINRGWHHHEYGDSQCSGFYNESESDVRDRA